MRHFPECFFVPKLMKRIIYHCGHFLSVLAFCFSFFTFVMSVARSPAATLPAKKKTIRSYSPAYLKQLHDRISKQLERAKGIPAAANAYAWGIRKNRVTVWLRWNTAAKQQEFRRTILDSPALLFLGDSRMAEDHSTGVSMTDSVALWTEYSVYADTTKVVRAFLRNVGRASVQHDSKGYVTFETADGNWLRLPPSGVSYAMATEVEPYNTLTLDVRLYPQVFNHRPGRFRYFLPVTINGQKKILKTEFRLSDNPEEWAHALKNEAPLTISKTDSTDYAENHIFYLVEQRPSFPGGKDALAAYLHPMFPKGYSGEEGSVQVQFVVEKDGSLTNISVVRSVNPELDAEALRVVRNMPHWAPGRTNGRIVRCYYKVSVTFQWR